MRLLGLFILSWLIGGIAFAAEPAVKVTPLMTKPLVGIEGQETAMITVEIPPGGDSPPHRHNANTFVYVLEGSVVMQVQGGKAVMLRAGQTFYESPTDVHLVSRNPSSTAPAKLLVVFVKPVGTPLSVPVR
ncbi:MAG TPA: cupin domain-containing protein [Steroidobacteraceae bacterium]|jgi:quercetin dioxygenase-like cupin family protein